MADWQTIETAPKDGTQVLLAEYDRAGFLLWMEAASWSDGGWADGRLASPSHWLPLDALPPSPQGREG